jgi:hypothetical protein
MVIIRGAETILWPQIEEKIDALVGQATSKTRRKGGKKIRETLEERKLV